MEILNQILFDKKHRTALIKEFQELIWNDENANMILSELAYDLDFYEPSEELRNQDKSYFGDERLEAEIRSAIQKLNDESLT